MKQVFLPGKLEDRLKDIPTESVQVIFSFLPTKFNLRKHMPQLERVLKPSGIMAFHRIPHIDYIDSFKVSEAYTEWLYYFSWDGDVFMDINSIWGHGAIGASQSGVRDATMLNFQSDPTMMHWSMVQIHESCEDDEIYLH